MQPIEAEIERASNELRLPIGALRRLHGSEHQDVFHSILETFVADRDAIWWWEHFRKPGVSVTFEAGDGWRLLTRVAPSEDAAVWLVASEESGEPPAIYETTPAVAQSVIGECYAFEYYVVARSLGWLVCENHHNAIIAIGAPVEERLRENAA